MRFKASHIRIVIRHQHNQFELTSIKVEHPFKCNRSTNSRKSEITIIKSVISKKGILITERTTYNKLSLRNSNNFCNTSPNMTLRGGASWIVSLHIVAMASFGL